MSTCFFTLSMRAAKFFELILGGREDAPDFVAFFLDGESVEAHLEAGEDSHESRRAGDGDTALRLNFGLQPWAANDFGVERFGGEKHDGVRHGGGRVDVLVADALALGADGAFKCFACGVDAFAGFVGVFEPLPVFFGKFCVDGEESMSVAVSVGEFESVLDGLERVGFDAGVLDVLLGGEHLLELLA